MNKDQEYPSDSDESDKDFCPENESDSTPSQEESDYKDSESEDEKNKNLTRFGKKKKIKSDKKIVKNLDNVPTSLTKSDNISDEEEKKRSDDLWASFLSDVNDTNDNCTSTSKITPNSKDEKKIADKNDGKVNELKTADKNDGKVDELKKKTVKEIVEFAGEKIEITKEITEQPKKDHKLNANRQNNLANKFSTGLLKRPGGGIGSVLNQIGKKTKISVLEKSKIDWDGFKKKEDLTEELHTFNKGKDGYLERQDFLQRTDLRQFEIEKSMRQARRKY